MLKVKPFQQSRGKCGPAVLKMVLAYFGVVKTEKELTKLTRCRPRFGVEAKPILEAARQIGFRGFIKDFASFEDVRDFVVAKKIPVIVDWFSGDDGHYAVVVGINDRFIYLQDPEIGRIRKMNLVTFKRVWFDFPGDALKSKNDLIIRRMLVIYPRRKREVSSVGRARSTRSTEPIG